MAANMAEMQVEETTVIGAPKRRGRGGEKRLGFYGAIAAALIAVLIVGVTMHDRNTFHPAVVTRTEQRFLENNTTNLPNAVTAEIYPVVTIEQQKYLDVNTTWLPAGAAVSAEDGDGGGSARIAVGTDGDCTGYVPVYCQVVVTDRDAYTAAHPATMPSDQRAIYRVSDSSYYVPAAGGMWVVVSVQAGGLAMIEDYVSGPPPASGIAVTPGDAVTGAQPICTDAPTARPTCYTKQGDGSWVVEVQGLDGGWMPVTTVAHPPTPDELASGYSG